MVVTVLLLLGLGSGAMGVLTLLGAKGALHETMGLVLWVVAAVLLAGAAVVDAVNTAARDILRRLTPAPDGAVAAKKGPYSEDLVA